MASAQGNLCEPAANEPAYTCTFYAIEAEVDPTARTVDERYELGMPFSGSGKDFLCAKQAATKACFDVFKNSDKPAVVIAMCDYWFNETNRCPTL